MTIKIFVLFFFLFSFYLSQLFCISFRVLLKKRRCDLFSCFSFCFYMYIIFLFVSNLRFVFVSSYAERSEIASFDSDIKNIQIYIRIHTFTHTRPHTHVVHVCLFVNRPIMHAHIQDAYIYIHISVYIKWVCV